MTPQQQAVLQRLKTDFPFWAATCWKIIDKDGNHSPLVLNRAQQAVWAAMERQRLAGVPIRVIVLKGRQQGISTMLEAWMVWRCTTARAKRGYVLAHQAESTQSLFEMSKRGFENLPDLIRPKAKRQNIKELVFGDLDSSLLVSTAGGKGVGRGRTFQFVHLSEVGFWEANSAESNFAGLIQTIPNSPDSAILVESTANGVGGLYHRLWQDAERGASDFEAVFCFWGWQPEYYVEPKTPLQHTPEESHLVAEYGLNDGQLLWRRGKVAAVGRDAFQQEFPCNANEAFLTSGRPVFETLEIHKLLEKHPEPIRRMALEPADKPDTYRFAEHGRGELFVYHKPVSTETYYIGADPSLGVRGGDWSVAQVLDSNMRQVAVWKGLIHPGSFADVLATLGDMYNDALIAVELNNHGFTTANDLAKRVCYPNVYTEITFDKVTDEQTEKLGFSTNPKTKPMILHKLRALVRDREIEINDKMTLKEMLSFALTSSGKMEAEAGAHDDHVMSLAIAVHINEGPWTPVLNSDKYYSEAL